MLGTLVLLSACSRAPYYEPVFDEHRLVRGEDPIDLVFVLDTSQSTNLASGADIDRDGRLGVNPKQGGTAKRQPEYVFSTDIGDTLLDLAADFVRHLLEDVDWTRDRVGIVTFAGEVDPATGYAKPGRSHARLELTLSGDPIQVEGTLRKIAKHGGDGATDFQAGLELARAELERDPRPATRRMVLLSDGLPTLPFGKGLVMDEDDQRAAIFAARDVVAAGIDLEVYWLAPAGRPAPSLAGFPAFEEAKTIGFRRLVP